MSKLNYWRIIALSILFGMSDRTLNSILQNYSVGSISQILVGGLLLLLVNQLYPYPLK